VSIEARGKYLGVVEDDEIPFAEQVRKLAKYSVANLARRALHMQHTGGSTVLERLLRDEFFGKVVVEVAYKHDLIVVESD
jgi:hypothetical protein